MTLRLESARAPKLHGGSYDHVTRPQLFHRHPQPVLVVADTYIPVRKLRRYAKRPPTMLVVRPEGVAAWSMLLISLFCYVTGSLATPVRDEAIWFVVFGLSCLWVARQIGIGRGNWRAGERVRRCAVGRTATRCGA